MIHVPSHINYLSSLARTKRPAPLQNSKVMPGTTEQISLKKNSSLIILNYIDIISKFIFIRVLKLWCYEISLQS